MAINKSEALQTAAQCVLKGDLAAAVNIHRKIIESDPYDLAAIISLSDLYVSARKTGEALNFLSRTAHDLLGRGLRMKAARLLQKRLEIDPADASVLMELGEIYSHEGLVEKAHEAFIEAGVHSLRKNDLAKALEAYKAALAIKPDSRRASVALALLMDDTAPAAASGSPGASQPEGAPRAKLPGALPHAATSALRPPARPPAMTDDTFIVQKISMAERLVGYGKVDEAVAMLKDLLKQSPENIDVHIKLKDIYLRTAEVDKAAEECLEISRIYTWRGDLASAKEYMVRMRLLSAAPMDSAGEPVEVQKAAGPATHRTDHEPRADETAVALVPAPEGDNNPVITAAPAESIGWPSDDSLSILRTESAGTSKASRWSMPRPYALAITAACLALLAGALTKGVQMYDARLDRQYEALARGSTPVVMPPPIIDTFDQPLPGDEEEVEAIDSPALQPDAPPQREREVRRAVAEERPAAPPAADAPPETDRRLSPAPPSITPIPTHPESIARAGATSEAIAAGAPGGGAGAPAAPPPPPVQQSGGVIKAVAIKKVAPVYPPLAKSSRQAGRVTVEVSINERGNVVSARAISGPRLLRAAAEEAAKGWKFIPCRLSGKPIPSVNYITFNFKP